MLQKISISNNAVQPGWAEEPRLKRQCLCPELHFQHTLNLENRTLHNKGTFPFKHAVLLEHTLHLHLEILWKSLKLNQLDPLQECY